MEVFVVETYPETFMGHETASLRLVPDCSVTRKNWKSNLVFRAGGAIWGSHSVVEKPNLKLKFS